MRVLVTGGAGFIGSHLVDALVTEGHEVAVVDDLSAGRASVLNPAVRLHRVSVVDIGPLERVFARERPEVVSHHAAHTSVRRSMADPSHDAQVNILGTLNVLQLCAKYKVARLVFASTSAVYSEPRYLPMDEAHPLAPQSAYGVAKHSAEGYIRLYADAQGLRYKILRYGNVYGPRQDPKGEAGVVAIFAGQLLSGISPTIFGDGTKTRDYVFVDDVVRANLLALAEAGDDEIYNIGRGVEVSDFQLFDAVRQAMGATIEPAYAQKRPGEADRVCLDWSKAKDGLGWTPTVQLQEGIGRAVAYYRQARQVG